MWLEMRVDSRSLLVNVNVNYQQEWNMNATNKFNTFIFSDETEGETNQYTVIYTLWDDEDAPTTSSQYITVKGTNGQTEEYECNSENFREPGAEVSCVIDSSVKIGNYRCLMLRTGGMDGLDFVRVRSG